MLRLLTPSIGHSVLRIAATSGILAGAFGMFQLGYLILTVDAVVKLLLTFAYTHLHSEAKSSSGKGLSPQLVAVKPDELEEVEKSLVRISDDELSLTDSDPDVVGCVVGWREDEELYARCLESLKSTPNCTTIVAGIDGDEAEDERMIDVFHKVSHGKILHLHSRTRCDCISDKVVPRFILTGSSFEWASLSQRR